MKSNSPLFLPELTGICRWDFLGFNERPPHVNASTNGFLSPFCHWNPRLLSLIHRTFSRNNDLDFTLNVYSRAPWHSLHPYKQSPLLTYSPFFLILTTPFLGDDNYTGYHLLKHDIRCYCYSKKKEPFLNSVYVFYKLVRKVLKRLLTLAWMPFSFSTPIVQEQL